MTPRLAAVRPSKSPCRRVRSSLVWPTVAPLRLSAAARVQRRAEGLQRVWAHPMKHIHAASIRDHQSRLAQLAQMVTDRGLTQVENGRELTGNRFAGGRTEQVRDDLDSHRIGKGLQSQ